MNANNEPETVSGLDKLALGDIMSQFQSAASEVTEESEAASSDFEQENSAHEDAEDTSELTAMLRGILEAPAQAADTPVAPQDIPKTQTAIFASVPELAADSVPEQPSVTAEFTRIPSAVADDTKVADDPASLNTTVREGAAQEPASSKEADFPETPSNTETAKSGGPIPLSRSQELRELKKKIVAGPEKRYYDLSEQGVTKLQIAMLLNMLLLLCASAAVAFFTLGHVPATRMKLMIFSQVLMMLLSGLLGSQILLDGISDLLHLRYSLKTALCVSFLACCADAWFCLDQQRVPCCAGFILAMETAMLSEYHRRTTEMSQMDTLRKASRLIGLVKEADYYRKYPGILRTQGDVEDFMDTYTRISGPEIVQRVYALIALIACIGIAVIAGMLYNISLALQVFSLSLLASVPACSFFALTRPASVLEKRLHMVGTVICGWRGVKRLCGRAVFPLTEKDLFPRGSAKLNGIKFYSERTPAEIVSYAASLCFEAGGSLVPTFRNLLNGRNGVEYPVTEFRDYGSGGIGGIVNNEPTLMGNPDFLRDMGVEIPTSAMVSQALYVAVDGELTAVIAVSYSKMRSASAGLVSLCSRIRLRPISLVGDFILTESFLRGKFEIHTKRMLFPDAKTRSELLVKTPSAEAEVLALASREDLISSAYAVTGAMALRSASRTALFISMIGGILGILIMGSLAYLGSTELLTPANTLLYQIVWLIPTFLATEWARRV